MLEVDSIWRATRDFLDVYEGEIFRITPKVTDYRDTHYCKFLKSDKCKRDESLNGCGWWINKRNFENGNMEKIG